MRSPRAWSYLTSLLVAPLLGACPPAPVAQETDSDPSTGTKSTDSSGSATTGECPIGDPGCPCTNGGACNPGLVCAPDQRCVDEDGTTSSATSTDSSTDEVSTTVSDSSTTDEPTECEPENGTLNADCVAIDPDQPYCADTNVCGGCTVLPADNGCALVAPGKPICNPEDGKCVACTGDDDSQCGGETPACNPVTNTCEGCFEHSHCPETACDILARTCFPTDRIIYIRHGTAEDGYCTNNVWQGGTIDAPYCNANQAIDHAQYEGASSGWTFKFLKTEFIDYYHGPVTVNGVGEPVSYAFVHEEEYSQELVHYQQHTRLQAADPVFTVGEDVTAYVKNFGLYSVGQSDYATGVTCLPGGKVFLDDSFVRDARGAGIRAVGCDVHLNRSSVFAGKSEGIELNCADKHCELHMVNSYISGNLFYQGKGGGGITAENAALDIAYSTILANNNEHELMDPMARGDSIHCVGDLVTGTIRNSVIARTQMGNVLSIKCDPETLLVTNSLIDSDLFKVGNQKKDSETIVAAFQDNLLTGARPVYKNAAAEVREMAVWVKGDPLVDFDGEPRVAKEAMGEYAGADVYVEK